MFSQFSSSLYFAQSNAILKKLLSAIMRLPPFSQESIGFMKARCASFSGGLFPVLERKFEFASNQKRAAVLIPLVNYNDSPSVIFTLRTTTVNSHKGQVSFPGGHLEPHESPQDAALRETWEELGFNSALFDIIGQGQTIPAITGTHVTPVIAFLRTNLTNLNDLAVSEDEVARVFVRSIDELRSPGFRSIEKVSRNGIVMEMPVFGPNRQEERIWGLTAFLLDAALHRVVYPYFDFITYSLDRGE
jgi:8-oxo-dGTP pyrophosphatase MutT (NUDIX family)